MTSAELFGYAGGQEWRGRTTGSARGVDDSRSGHATRDAPDNGNRP